MHEFPSLFLHKAIALASIDMDKCEYYSSQRCTNNPIIIEEINASCSLSDLPSIHLRNHYDQHLYPIRPWHINMQP